MKFYGRSQVGAGDNTNVPYVFKDADWMLWGYSGGGPQDFAINILYHFTGGDEEFARLYALDFVVEVISMLPHDKCGTLKARTILNWILPRKEGLIKPFHKKVTWISINDEYRENNVIMFNFNKLA